MAEAVKNQVGRRERKALATRRRVLDAAEELFIRDGYGATRITAIAEAADVAVQTVYAVFRTKRAMLTELLWVRTVGGDQSIHARGNPPLARLSVRDTPDWRLMEREPDARQQLALLARVATQVGGRLAMMYEVLASAAGSDLEIAELYREQQQARYRDQRRLARSLARKGSLRPGLSETRATDLMWTLANPRTYHSLVHDRGWKPADYERWLAHLLVCTLLRETCLDVQ